MEIGDDEGGEELRTDTVCHEEFAEELERGNSKATSEELNVRLAARADGKPSSGIQHRS